MIALDLSQALPGSRRGVCSSSSVLCSWSSRLLCSHGHELGSELHADRKTPVRRAGLHCKFLSALTPGMPACGVSWREVTVITVTKHFEHFQKPRGRLYISSDTKSFVSPLPSDKKLTTIWHRAGISGPRKPSSLTWGLKRRLYGKPSSPSLSLPVSCWHGRCRLQVSSRCDIGGLWLS